MKKLTLLFILLFTLQVFAQDKPIALKFDEFTFPRNQSFYYANYYAKTFNYDYQYDLRKNSYNYEKISFNDRVIRFAQEVLNQKDSTAYIIFYNQRKGNYPLDKGKTESQSAVDILTNYSKYGLHPNPKYKISSNRVFSIDGGLREEPTLEFWIVPQNAEPPKPTPSFGLSETVICPKINVTGPHFIKERTQPLNFSVALKGEEPNSNLSLEWNVSVGKIIKGQGTNQIEVDLTNTNTELISASVQVKGLHPECNNHDFASTEVNEYSIKVDETGGIYPGDFKARLDQLNLYVQGEPNSTAYIIIYGSRGGNKKDVLKVMNLANDAIKFRQYPKDKIKVIDGGYREELMIEYFFTPDGVAPPKLTPTVDAKFINQPKKLSKNARKQNK